MTPNLFSNIPDSSSNEIFETILENKSLKLERILSYGKATPAGEWYDQSQDEWMLLLKGRAGIRFESEDKIVELAPGDHLLISAHKRHRVEWTDQDGKTVWLALHF